MASGLTGVVVGGLVEVGGEKAHDEEERQPEDPDSQEVRTPDEWLAPEVCLQVVLAMGAESKSAVPADLAYVQNRSKVRLL